MLSPQAAVAIVQGADKHNEVAALSDIPNTGWLNPSKCLVERALERWSSTKMRADNTSVVTIMLDPPGPPKAQVLRNLKKNAEDSGGLKILMKYEDQRMGNSSDNRRISESMTTERNVSQEENARNVEKSNENTRNEESLTNEENTRNKYLTNEENTTNINLTHEENVRNKNLVNEENIRNKNLTNEENLRNKNLTNEDIIRNRNLTNAEFMRNKSLTNEEDTTNERMMEGQYSSRINELVPRIDQLGIDKGKHIRFGRSHTESGKGRDVGFKEESYNKYAQEKESNERGNPTDEIYENESHRTESNRREYIAGKEGRHCNVSKESKLRETGNEEDRGVKNLSNINYQISTIRQNIHNVAKNKPVFQTFGINKPYQNIQTDEDSSKSKNETNQLHICESRSFHNYSGVHSQNDRQFFQVQSQQNLPTTGLSQHMTRSSQAAYQIFQQMSETNQQLNQTGQHTSQILKKTAQAIQKPSPIKTSQTVQKISPIKTSQIKTSQTVQITCQAVQKTSQAVQETSRTIQETSETVQKIPQTAQNTTIQKSTFHTNTHQQTSSSYLTSKPNHDNNQNENLKTNQRSLNTDHRSRSDITNIQSRNNNEDSNGEKNRNSEKNLSIEKNQCNSEKNRFNSVEYHQRTNESSPLNQFSNYKNPLPNYAQNKSNLNVDPMTYHNYYQSETPHSSAGFRFDPTSSSFSPYTSSVTSSDSIRNTNVLNRSSPVPNLSNLHSRLVSVNTKNRNTRGL